MECSGVGLMAGDFAPAFWISISQLNSNSGFFLWFYSLIIMFCLLNVVTFQCVNSFTFLCGR